MKKSTLKALRGTAGFFLVLTLPVTIYLMAALFFAYNGPFYRYEFKKNNVYEQVPEANKISNQLFTYYSYFNRSYDLPEIKEFGDAEKSHARDVKKALHKGQDILYSMGLIQAMLILFLVRNRKMMDLVMALSGIGSTLLTGAGLFLLPCYFELFFDKLHEFLFKPGTWYFFHGQPFIEMFPFPFFMAVGTGIVILSLAISVVISVLGLLDYTLFSRSNKNRQFNP